MKNNVNPFDRDTKPYSFTDDLIDTIVSNIPETIKGKAGKYLRVKSDETGTEWASGGGGGTDDYNDLINKPKINSVELEGNRTLSELNIASASETTTALSNKQDKHIVVGWNDTPTDFGYPSEKLVKESLDLKEPLINPKNNAFNLDFGQIAGTICEGNDNRLYNNRTPTAHASNHTKGGSDVISIDASQITSGVIDASHVPAATYQKLIVVANEAARKALTSSDVAKGDTVKQNDTGIMYFCIDTSKLSTDDGWMVYTAVTPWNSISGRPTMPKGATGTLTAEGWDSDTKEQTVNITGVTADCYVIVEPQPSYYQTYVDNGILCTAQGNGTLTFKCSTVPAANITFSVVMVF